MSRRRSIRKLRLGMMPPKEASRKPDAATRLALVTALETTLDAAASVSANPGRRSFQRLNRAEYAAAIRSLFGLDIDVSTYLPADTISASFDNIADVQMPSATVMQGYMRAAAHVSRVAVGDPFDRRQLDAVRSAADEVTEGRASKARPSARAAARSSPTTSRPTATTSSRCCCTASRPGFLFGRTVREIQMEVAIDGDRVALLKVDRWMSESDPEGLTVSTPPIYVRAGRAPRCGHVHPGVRGLGRRSHQADRPHAGRHANRRRLRRDDAAAPAQSRRRRPVRGDGRVRSSGAGARSSAAVRRRRRKTCACARTIIERLATQAYRGAGVCSRRRRADALLR